jgi:hypothetical protein
MKIKNDNSSFIWIKENNYHSNHSLVEDSVETSAYTINFNLMPIRGIRFLLGKLNYLAFGLVDGKNIKVGNELYVKLSSYASFDSS